MCGIVAKLGTSSIGLAVEETRHRGLRHRITRGRHGAVGHVRLPIVGLGEIYDQPIQTGKWTVAFVGEIMDFRERDPKAECDVDLVVKTWAAHGPSGFTDFDGFWAVVALDDRDGILHVLCDYLAQKPMYYRADEMAAASEPDALVKMAPVTPDEVYLSAVVKWGYCPDTTRTPYEEIKHVLPGEHVEIRLSGEVKRTIIDPLTKHPPADLKAEIRAAVKRRVLSSDVPVAVLVSGGLDSSIVYSVAKDYGIVRPYYADGEADVFEQAAVRQIVGNNPISHISWSEVTMDRALTYMQEPIDLGSLFPQVALSDQIEERVCLTGDGADELFGGYGRAMRYDSQGSDVWQELVAWHLPRLDRVMMRNKIEIRPPFLARRVAGAALSLPWEMRRDKRILRELFADDLPQGIASSPKKPLRTREVFEDREANSIKLVKKFREHAWPS